MFWAVRELLCEAIKSFTPRLYYLGSRTRLQLESVLLSPLYSHTSVDCFNVLCTNKTSSVSCKYSIMNLTLIDQFRNVVSTRLSATGKHVISCKLLVVAFVKQPLLKSTHLRYLTVFWLDDTKLDNETCDNYSCRVWHRNSYHTHRRLQVGKQE